MTELVFTVQGQPVGKQRARKGRGKRHYTPAATVAFERRVALASEIARRDAGLPLLTKGVRLHVDAFFRAKKGAKHTAPIPKMTKPDASNVLKAVEDAMETCVYAHDSRVASTSCDRWWQVPGKAPCVVVRVASMEGEWS